VRGREHVRAAVVAVLVSRVLPVPVENAEPPVELCCLISHDLLDDPVLLVGDGMTYSRANVTKWLETHSTSPGTNAELSGAQLALAPNIAMRQLVAKFVEKQPQQANLKKRRRLVDGNSAGAAASDDAAEAAEARAACAEVERHEMASGMYSSWT
jgi:hypothetical protein